VSPQSNSQCRAASFNPSTIIEVAVNGVQDSIYMSSTSSSDGSYSLTVTFNVGTDLDTSLALVQNAVNGALAQLPDGATEQGVSVRKVSTGILLVISLYPAAVILAVSMAVVGILLALIIRGFDNNLYTQVGLVLMIALASKNAILIVEFARDLQRWGRRQKMSK
jgi:multidrug efflux pump subunit AcrB